MDIQDVQIFISIVRTGNLSKASEFLHLAQSTISHRLASLEQELGGKLLTRDKGSKIIRLTPTGERFMEIANRLVDAWREAKTLKSSEHRLFLSMGVIDSINNFVLPPVYRMLRSSNPPVDFSVRTDYSFEIYNMVERREVDIGFVFIEIQRPSIIVQPFIVEPMVILRPASAQSTDGAIICPSDLEQNHEIFFIQGPAYHMWHDKWWNRDHRNRVAIDCCFTVLAMLRKPQHWSIVPISFAHWATSFGRFTINYLNDPYLRICYKVTHKAPRDSASEALETLSRYTQRYKPLFDDTPPYKAIISNLFDDFIESNRS
jgi:LysR family transcriptional regulator, transcriptional activator of the cysJI operon